MRTVVVVCCYQLAGLNLPDLCQPLRPSPPLGVRVPPLLAEVHSRSLRGAGSYRHDLPILLIDRIYRLDQRNGDLPT